MQRFKHEKIFHFKDFIQLVSTKIYVRKYVKLNKIKYIEDNFLLIKRIFF